MSVYVESNIAFDFAAARTVIEHDKIRPTHPGGRTYGNNVWPGVDFCIEETTGEWIWLKVKSWNPKHIAAHRRGGTRWSFICKMKSKEFAKEMRGKFLGTTAFLALRNTLSVAPIQFVMLFEPPKPLDSALVGSRATRMQSLIPNRPDWTQPVYVAVLTMDEWNVRFPDYPARIIQQTGTLDSNAPVSVS